MTFANSEEPPPANIPANLIDVMNQAEPQPVQQVEVEHQKPAEDLIGMDIKPEKKE